MAINKFMLSALRALSYADIDVKKNYAAERKLQLQGALPLSSPLLYKIDDRTITLDGYDIPVRIFEPKNKISDQLLLFFHGGGWVTGNIDSYSRVCSVLASRTGRAVFSVDYRLAPEHPFPHAVNDCYFVTRELFLNKSFGLNGDDIILIGDSAGGNLAAAVSLMARDKGEFAVKNQILIYPSTYNDHTDSSPFPSVRENGTDYLLTSKKICDYMALYCQSPGDIASPYFAPLLTETFRDQPRTLIITAEYDPLRDEGEAYGLRLRDYGGYAEIHRMPDALHGFFSLPYRYVHVKNSYELINRFIARGGGAERRHAYEQ
ncbi:MAG: alpha/beta hydrolase [Oscillospiraceae bacterium]|jgi:acetyl esterase/lipase|nr:alpha/beta hydrolase [Oscillospiraceae bacterium]